MQRLYLIGLRGDARRAINSPELFSCEGPPCHPLGETNGRDSSPHQLALGGRWGVISRSLVPQLLRLNQYRTRHSGGAQLPKLGHGVELHAALVFGYWGESTALGPLLGGLDLHLHADQSHGPNGGNQWRWLVP